jgi:hypothetical protein
MELPNPDSRLHAEADNPDGPRDEDWAFGTVGFSWQGQTTEDEDRGSDNRGRGQRIRQPRTRTEDHWRARATDLRVAG